MKKIVLFGLVVFLFASCKQEECTNCQPQLVHTKFIVYDGFERDTLTVLGRPKWEDRNKFTVQWEEEINFATNNVVKVISVF